MEGASAYYYLIDLMVLSGAGSADISLAEKAFLQNVPRGCRCDAPEPTAFARPCSVAISTGAAKTVFISLP